MKQEFTMNLNSPTLHSDNIRQALEQLMSLRNTTPNRAELEWEIRLYRFILADKDPEAAAKLYYEARYIETKPGEFRMLSKRAVVAKLGWRVS